SIFDRLGREITVTDVYNREDAFWTDFSRGNSDVASTSRVDAMTARLRHVPLYYWSEKILKILIGGYISTGKHSRFDYGPVLSTVSYNDLEGLRLRAGGMTTANLFRRVFLQGYGAYGFKDHKWKYNGVVEYSFTDKQYHRSEFPIHSIRLSHLYDVDKLGQHYLFTSPDNGLLSISRLSDKLITYHRVSALEYTLELRNNFSTRVKLQHERQEASPYIAFTDGYGQSRSHYGLASATVELRYAPGEKFYQQPGGARKCINFDAPVFTLSHTVAPRGVFGNRYTLNVTEASFQKRFWLSAFGAIDAKIKGGHVWSAVPFPNLLIPNANLSYTLQPESFACLNPMEFINDSYVQWGMTYWANGVIFNYIPLLKKLKLRESIMFNGIFGHLSRRNDPTLHPDLFTFPADANVQRMKQGLPYMEAAFGVVNILNLFRVDYVWRLT
ncbi:MAG: carboxypeptidase-like regulatory domain-containing protein, partial [Duncaniella sp.]|nr:carboxypeptidase-like regulatory domain-containing protein [Duncaniella sp.]